jgi:hypothetical protein
VTGRDRPDRASAKALGQCLKLDLRSVSIELDAPQPHIVGHAVDGRRTSPCQCRLHVPLDGHRLALVVRDRASEIDVRFERGLPLRNFAPAWQTRARAL